MGAQSELEAERMKQVYLAGGKSQGWRKQVKRRWGDLAETFDPFTQSRQSAAYEFTNDDLEAIRQSDLVFAVVDYPVYTGVSAEVGFAHALGIPVILVWDTVTEGSQAPIRVEMFTASMCAAVFTGVAEAASFVKDRYLR